MTIKRNNRRKYILRNDNKYNIIDFNIISGLIHWNECSSILVCHLNKVYGMDTFYGDTTLESLLEHTKTVADKIENFVSTTEQVTEGKTDAS